MVSNLGELYLIVAVLISVIAGRYHNILYFFFIMPRSHFDNALYFDITLTPNGVIVLWSALI